MCKHTSATQFPGDVENPIAHSHTSPFMTRNKPSSDRSMGIMDLSWPQGVSVNFGTDRDTYLGSPFTLTFPTVDHNTSELKHLGRGALLYKIDVSRAFHHVHIDPGDYDLLGLQWCDAYIDTCVPFCLGVLINTEEGTVSIPPDKLYQISDTVHQWLSRASCTKHQLQSIFGLLLYVHKCVKPAHAFLNRMLAILRSSYDSQKLF